jgi:hypothetical protein
MVPEAHTCRVGKEDAAAAGNNDVTARVRKQKTIDTEIEDHVWFEDRWMVTSLCDE